ncbi:MAG TPA: hypothetical protein VE223_02360 [Nitrososphaeraceae archaeon]|nr:hypothetical protein [Nitrososphaeraceae archaeon]
MSQQEELKSILQEEIQNLKINLMKNHAQKRNNATDRLLSRLAYHNGMIRINTIDRMGVKDNSKVR